MWPITPFVKNASALFTYQGKNRSPTIFLNSRLKSTKRRDTVHIFYPLNQGSAVLDRERQRRAYGGGSYDFAHSTGLRHCWGRIPWLLPGTDSCCGTGGSSRWEGRTIDNS